MANKNKKITPNEMLSQLINSRIRISPTGCWEYTKYKNEDGYAQISFNGKAYGGHRLMWTLIHGSPGRLHVLHKCDNPPCINPDHLFLGTNRDNMNDRTQKGRQWNKKKTHCIRGHEFNAENSRPSNTGGRRCKVCNTLRKRESDYRLKQYDKSAGGAGDEMP